MPYLAKILLYPIKSLDGVAVEKATILSSGALAYDREFAIFDHQGKLVNAKRQAKIHLLRCQISPASRTISWQIPGQDSPQVFHLDQQRLALEAALSDFFGFAVKLQQNSILGFPDDTNAPGATVVSTASLTEVASWFPGMSVEEMRRRIRANIEIGGVPAFWEDQLFTTQGNTVSFQVGDVHFLGVNPCQRCVVPTRDSFLGTADANFPKIFVQQRQATLPSWVDTSQFKHFYSLSVNTRLPASETGKTLQIGDQIQICSPPGYFH
jgi:uncharacterized protein YcbX